MIFKKGKDEIVFIVKDKARELGCSYVEIISKRMEKRLRDARKKIAIHLFENGYTIDDIGFGLDRSEFVIRKMIKEAKTND